MIDVPDKERQALDPKLRELLKDAEDPEDGFVFCASCSHVVAKTSDRIEVAGAFTHRLTNPHGFHFRVGCFSEALGCGLSGQREAADSWFAGFDADHIAVVWLGYDDNRSTTLTGAAGAMKIWDRLYGRLAVSPLTVTKNRQWREIEYTSGLLANSGCADVVSVPLPDGAVLRAKEGCGINLRNLTERLRRNVESWFSDN